MRRIAGLLAVACAWVLLATPALSLPTSTNGLVVTSATLEVQSVSSPTTWVPTATVYEGSPARLSLVIDSPGLGVVRTVVSLPGVSSAVADTSAAVPAGSTTLNVPLDLSYGAWLAGSLPNSADHLDVSVEFTATPPASSVAAPSAASPTLTAAVPVAATTTLDSPSPGNMAPTITRPVRLVMTGSLGVDRRSMREAIASMPPGATVIALIRGSRSDNCPSAKQLTRLVTSLARASGRSVVIRKGPDVRKGCARLELSPSNEIRARSISTSAATTFTVPIALAPRPLILVHGMWSTASIWSSYTDNVNRLSTVNSRWRGYAVSTMDTGSVFFPYAAVNSIQQNAALAWTYVQQRMSALNAHEVDVLAHSLGGVITRRMLHDPTFGAAAQAAIRSVVLLGTPNGGSSCSDAWSVPANAELTYTAMDTFNLAYPGYPGAFTTSLYSDNYSSTCFDSNAGDLFVPAWSTQAQSVNVVREIDPGVQHANMPGSSGVFTDYVLPALALAGAPAAAGPTVPLTNPQATSTTLFQGTATGSPLSVTRTVTIQSGRSLVASVVGDSATTGTLTYPSGSGTATATLVEIGDYPVFEAEVSYASLGGTTGPVTVSVTLDATTTAASPEWRWSLVTR